MTTFTKKKKKLNQVVIVFPKLIKLIIFTNFFMQEGLAKANETDLLIYEL